MTNLRNTACFNSRTPAGCDPCPRASGGDSSGFNSRTPAGCDSYFSFKFWFLAKFQLTHPCGVRPDAYQEIAKAYLFQLTHPCGVRHRLVHEAYTLLTVSTHAPLRGATTVTFEPVIMSMFQLTHPCGVRPAVIITTSSDFLFQLTHPCGVRLLEFLTIENQPLKMPFTRTGVSRCLESIQIFKKSS